MAGMYPENQTLEIFGQEVEWPGMGADGKFTNGSFSDPLEKPSMIPAGHINLLTDVLSELIKDCGGTLSSTQIRQLASRFTPEALALSAVRRDSGGRAKFAAPLAAEDAARLADITPIILQLGGLSAWNKSRKGRNLFTVLGVNNIADCMPELRRRCNNNGEIDASGFPYFDDLCPGDYIDGIDLSAIPAERGGTAGQEWIEEYKNNRIVIAGFNTYKGSGDTENTDNHILFVFANIPLRGRMNSSNDNTGGYIASEMRAFLEGVNGDGTGDKSGVTTAAFLNALKAQIGADYLYKIRKEHSQKGSASWANYTLWLPTEIEVFGYQTYGDEANYGNTNVQFPLYRDSEVYRVKRYNGARDWWWEHSPSAASAANFCNVGNNGNASYGNASAAGGCAPAFCAR